MGVVLGLGLGVGVGSAPVKTGRRAGRGLYWGRRVVDRSEVVRFFIGFRGGFWNGKNEMQKWNLNHKTFSIANLFLARFFF